MESHLHRRLHLRLHFHRRLAQSVQEIYPQVFALPIARRPLFPGFYIAFTVRNPDVVAAGQPYLGHGLMVLGAFLLKDENTDSDVLTDISCSDN